MTKEHSDQTKAIQGLVDRFRAGDDSAREELIGVASERLLRLTRKLKGGFQCSVGRWEQTEDVFQRSSLRLYQSLAKIERNDAAHVFNLAATQIRRELIDLARHYQGAEGLGANHLTQMALAEPDGAEGRRPNPVFDPAEALSNSVLNQSVIASRPDSRKTSKCDLRNVFQLAVFLRVGAGSMPSPLRMLTPRRINLYRFRYRHLQRSTRHTNWRKVHSCSQIDGGPGTIFSRARDYQNPVDWAKLVADFPTPFVPQDEPT